MKKQKYNNIEIDLVKLEKEEWKYLKELFPYCVRELDDFFSKQGIQLKDVWLDSRDLYDFFDERKIITFVSWSKKFKMFVSKTEEVPYNNAINTISTFESRFEAEVSGFIHAIKIREKELEQYFRNK